MILLFLAPSIIGCRPEPEVSLVQLSASISKGIHYLEVMQNETGSFDGYDFDLIDPNDKYKDDPIGYTIYTTWNLIDLTDSAQIKQIVTKSGEYIYSRRSDKSGYSFWRWRENLPFDADDTVLAGIILNKLGCPVKIKPENFMNGAHTFNTWINKSSEEPDLLVQLNVTSYLFQAGRKGKGDLDILTSQFTDNQLKSYYYKHYEAAYLFHFVSFGFQLPKQKPLQNKIYAIIKTNNFKSNIHNSYLGFFLLRSNLHPEVQQKIVHALLKAQSDDGSWPMEETFHSYGLDRAEGSPSLTTSYVLKFLNAYKENLTKKKESKR
jgi:hypothetical protein